MVCTGMFLKEDSRSVFLLMVDRVVFGLSHCSVLFTQDTGDNWISN